MAVILSNKNFHLTQEAPNYAVNNIVYIRGKKEDYNKVKSLYNSHLQSTRIKNRIKSNARQMMDRYIALRNEAYSLTSGSEIKFSENELIKMQEQWVNAISANLGEATGNFSEQAASTMKKVQQLLSTIQDNDAKQQFEEIHQLVIQLEQLFNTLSAEDKADLAGLIYDSKLLEGKIINVRKGEIVFSRMKSTLYRLSKYPKVSISNFIRNTNREFGALQEVMDTFALHQIEKGVQEVGKGINNLKVQQTGSTQVRDEFGRTGTGTTDALFTYDVDYNGNKLLFNFGISLKTTGTIIDENGKWVQKQNAADIKIKSISAQYKMWNNLLTALGTKSAQTENAVLNTLVWSNANSNSYKIITKSLLSAFFEKYLSGGNILTTGLGIDISDAIMINGTPIPVTAIIASIVEQLDSNDFLNKNKSLAYIELDVENKWIGSNENNIMDAIKRSKQTEQLIKKNLSAKVYLNGNILYNIAKRYMKT